MKKVSQVIFAGVMLGAIILPLQAQAEDAKIFPAALCREIGSDNSITYNSAGQVYNARLQAKHVVCPITRDTVKKKWNWIKVRVRDRHYSKNVSCRAYSRNIDGAGGWSRGASSAGSATGFQTLVLSAPGGQYNWGVYHVNCTLPGKYSSYQSGMAAIQLNE